MASECCGGILLSRVRSDKESLARKEAGGGGEGANVGGKRGGFSNEHFYVHFLGAWLADNPATITP